MYLCHLQFLLSMPYSIQYTNLSTPWWNVFLSISILIDSFINGIAFLISLSNTSLFVCRNATSYCMLILCPLTLFNSFINSFSSVYVAFRLSLCKTTSSVNIPFNFLRHLDAVYFLCSIALSRSSSIRVNRMK